MAEVGAAAETSIGQHAGAWFRISRF